MAAGQAWPALPWPTSSGRDSRYGHAALSFAERSRGVSGLVGFWCGARFGAGLHPAVHVDEIVGGQLVLEAKLFE